MKKLAFFILLSLVTLGVSAQSNLKWNVNAGSVTPSPFTPLEIKFKPVWKDHILVLAKGTSKPIPTL